jgi:WD40 repeat protein
VAFIDHQYARDDAGSVAVVDKSANKKTLSTLNFVSAQGLAWHPIRNEIWFSATTSGSSRALYAVSPGKKERLVYLGTGTLTLHDISKDGRVLFSRDDWRNFMLGVPPGTSKERDLSWHDWTVPRDLTDDGKIVAFDETGEAGEDTGAFYIRGTDGSPAVRLGNGVTPALSRDGKKVLAMVPGRDGKRRLTELPTGAGDPRVIPTGDVEVQGATFFPDGRTILEFGNAAGANGQRLWVQEPNSGKPRPISPEGVDVHIAGSISPDGKRVAAADPDGKIAIYFVDGGEPAAVAGTTSQDRALQWKPDGKSLLVAVVDAPNVVYEVEVGTGKRKLFRTIPVPDGARAADLGYPIFSKDFQSYVYAFGKIESDLYVVEGLK